MTDEQSAALRFDELVARARADARIVGLVLAGSRATGAGARPDSDYDVRVVFAEDDRDLARELVRPREAPLDVSVMVLAEFRAHARPGSANEWDRYTFTHARVLVDKLEGEIQQLVDEKGSLGGDERARIARGALDAYLNSLYRSLKKPTLRLAARLHAAESVAHLLTCLFALEGRIRPYHDYLVWELETKPLDGWNAPDLLALIQRVLTGAPAPQQELFRRVEPHVRAHDLGDVVDSWETDVELMRGSR